MYQCSVHIHTLFGFTSIRQEQSRFVRDCGYPGESSVPCGALRNGQPHRPNSWPNRVEKAKKLYLRVLKPLLTPTHMMYASLKIALYKDDSCALFLSTLLATDLSHSHTHRYFSDSSLLSIHVQLWPGLGWMCIGSVDPNIFITSNPSPCRIM